MYYKKFLTIFNQMVKLQYENSVKLKGNYT